MAEWQLTFQISAWDSEESRKVLKRLTKLDPLPIRAEYIPEREEVEVLFAVDVEGQFEAVRCQNEIDDKLQTALKDIDVGIEFGNPAPAPKQKQGS
ncbi:MAG: hypothetical protein AAB363_05180 [Planctomycetota bacterium]